MKRAIAAEALGSFFLFATVVGSGIMAERLAGGNVAVALLGNTLATGAMLFVLITMLGPISGAHFNPAVSLVFRLRGELPSRSVLFYLLAQVAGGVAGVWAAHLMFDLPVLQFSEKARTGVGQWSGEFIANFWTVIDNFGHVEGARAHGSRQRRAVYSRSLLVHLVHQLCQSGDHHCTQPEQQLCWHCASRCDGLYCGANGGCGFGLGCWKLAVSDRIESCFLILHHQLHFIIKQRFAIGRDSDLPRRHAVDLADIAWLANQLVRYFDLDIDRLFARVGHF